MLNELGFEWSVGFVKRQSKALEQSWMNWYRELVNFREEQGHCDVPNLYKDNKSLVRWVQHQRVYYKMGMLSEERIEMLNELSFEWSRASQAGKRVMISK
ncbi:hypothetical protein ACHAXN_005149 [Cyclotella atomus]|jgi:hypothetical protein